jgi:hypothetical protein
MPGLKISLSTIILTLLLFTAVSGFCSTDLAYGQFFETNSTDFPSNSTAGETEDSNAADIVLLSQKLKKGSFGYRDLVGQVKNIGNDTAESVKIVLDTFDKNGDIIGTDYTYATANTLEPNQKSSFDLSSQSENFKGMDHYEISLQWNNPDFSEGYVENAQIYKSNSTGTDD